MKQLPVIFILLIFNSISVLSQQNFAKPFKDRGIDGSITIFDYNAGKWISSDITDSHKPSLPASTFKILNTLISLETGVISGENEIIKWPGTDDTTKYGFRPDIYHDMTLKEAFKVSAVWAYIELAKKIGKSNYNKYLSACKYGNCDISVDGTDFWNFGALAISPVNEIEILIGVYKETLPFSKQNFEILKSMMIEEQTEDYILRAKTGWTKFGGKDIGWWVGYVERKDNVYFFATRLTKDKEILNPAFGAYRREITRQILKEMKILN